MSKSRIALTIIILLTTIILITFLTPNYVYAGTPSKIDPTEWEPGDAGSMTQITDSAGIIVSVIRVVGIIVTVVVLMVLVLFL